MDCEDVVALTDEIRQMGGELDDVEAKAAQGGLPERIYHSLSALSNRQGGGVILSATRSVENCSSLAMTARGQGTSLGNWLRPGN